MHSCKTFARQLSPKSPSRIGRVYLESFPRATPFFMHSLNIDDESPKVPNPADDSLSSPQSRRYWREQGPSGPNQRGSSEGALFA